MKFSKTLIYVALFLFLASTFPASAVGEPSITTLSAQNVGFTSAVLRGSESQSLSQPVTAWFEYGTSQSLGASIGQQVIPYPQSLSNQFNFTIAGLEPGTTYYYRAMARNEGGTSTGAIIHFTTSGNSSGSAPIVSTNSATFVSQNSVTLNGSVNPNGTLTNAWFEWGPTSSLGTTAGTQSVGNGNSTSYISTGLSGLSPGTTYFFRAVAQNSFGTAQGLILQFTTQGSSGASNGGVPSVTTLPASSVGETYGTLNATVNPNGLSTDAWFEWGTTANLGSIAGSQFLGSGTVNTSLFVALNFLQTNTTYYFRAVARNSHGTSVGSILSFTTSLNSQGVLPSVTTNSATGVSQSSAVLNGSVNPNNSFTTAWFEWGSSSSLGNTTGTQSIGNSNSHTPLSFGLTGLSSNTTYYFRVVAQNNSGTVQGSILSFTTQGDNSGNGAPFVSTNFANVVSQNSATLNGSVNPNGGYTTTWFEYGPSPSLGSSIGFQAVGSGQSTQSFSSTLSGLFGNTTYYFRAVGQNSSGTSYGTILNFATSGFTNLVSSAPTVSTLPVTGVFQTSATLHGLVTSNGNFTRGWFEWGFTPALGTRTTDQFTSTDQSLHEMQVTLSTLSPHTTYYFRAAAQNSFGTNYGGVLSFTTTGPVVFVPSPPATGSPPRRTIPSSLSLTPSVSNTTPAPGEKISYTLAYENTDDTNTITNLLLRLTLPKNVSFLNSDLPTLSISGQNIRFKLDNLASTENATLNADLKISEDAKKGDSLAINAIVTYRDAAGNPQSANAVITITVAANGGFLSSLFSTLQIPVGWLIVIIIAMFLLLIAYRRFLAPRDPLAK